MRNNQAFTLIELLVVVLIIGILAGVALPQYQKAVWKSRNTQLKQIVSSVAQAAQAYHMANGKYPANFDELDIDLPLTPVATTVGGGTGACNTSTQGTDASRAGKDFYVVLNATAADLSSGGVVAYYSTGKYACAGFGIWWHPSYPDMSQLHCREMRNSSKYTAGTGAFCEKIEKGTSTTPSESWRAYKLP